MIAEATSSSLSIPVPNIITSSPSGGRYDFDDGGSYCGGWQDGKAHGHGVCTGPKNIGEYSGSFNFGFEMSGVYKWKNGAIYEGRWQHGKRHGVGVEYAGKWVYKGEWSQGLKGRYGVKASQNSAVKYEGTWASGLQDGYGSETYSDGGFYQGQMFKGLRHGYGVRKSAPYGDSQLNNPNKNGAQSLMGASKFMHTNSLQSNGSVDLDDDSPKADDGFKPNIDRTVTSKNGFVLVAKPLDIPISFTNPSPTPSSSNTKNNHNNPNLLGTNHQRGERRGSLTGKIISSARISSSNQAMSLLRGLRLKKQKSTSDLETLVPVRSGGGISARSTGGNVALNSDDSSMPTMPFSLSPEELDITDPTTVETYTGEWRHDKRNGHGVCERSDGLKYEGQWHNDMKCGYGVTTFKNKTKEEGKYKNNIFIVDSKMKRFFQLGSSNIRQRIDDAVKMAHQAQALALSKGEIAETRAASARNKADQALTAALEAQRDSQIAFSVANQYNTDTQHQGAMNNMNFGFHPQQNPQFMINALDPMMTQVPPQQFNPNNPINPGGMVQLGLTPSSLQMRRISQNQQRFGSANQPINLMNPNQDQTQLQHHQQQDQQEQQQQNRQQQSYSTGNPVEPFNGRRGSFRGSLSQTGGAFQQQQQQQSSFVSRNTKQPNSSNFINQQQSQSNSSSSNQPRARLHYQNSSAADPFNDLFDHYKSTVSSISGNSSRRMLGKQASLDYPSNGTMRSSVPRQFGPGAYNGNSADRMRRFRMSSLDHAEENANQQRQPGQMQDLTIDGSRNSFKYLITSGEELQQQQQQQQQQDFINVNNPLLNEAGNQSQVNALTPTGSNSYAANSAGGSSLGAPGTQTSPSPDGGYQISPAEPQPYYAKQQAQRAAQAAAQAPMYANYQTMNNEQFVGGQYPMQPMMRQRDVQSLADEQLFMAAGRRAYELYQQNSNPTEFSKYDFTISETPPLSRQCMRRTNSLSRNTPIRSSSTGRTETGVSFSGSRNKLHNFQTIQRSTSALPQQVANQTNISHNKQDFNKSTNQINQSNNVNISPPTATCEGDSSHLTISSAASSALIRKPSLQVRYDLLNLGGLMSREEVAALSHAQREQKRLEAEMAEKRAKRPFLHLYLSLKEFVASQKLILCICVVNIIILKTFVDLFA